MSKLFNLLILALVAYASCATPDAPAAQQKTTTVLATTAPEDPGDKILKAYTYWCKFLETYFLSSHALSLMTMSYYMAVVSAKKPLPFAIKSNLEKTARKSIAAYQLPNTNMNAVAHLESEEEQEAEAEMAEASTEEAFLQTAEVDKKQKAWAETALSWTAHFSFVVLNLWAKFGTLSAVYDLKETIAALGKAGSKANAAYKAWMAYGKLLLKVEMFATFQKWMAYAVPRTLRVAMSSSSLSDKKMEAKLPSVQAFVEVLGYLGARSRTLSFTLMWWLSAYEWAEAWAMLAETGYKFADKTKFLPVYLKFRSAWLKGAFSSVQLMLCYYEFQKEAGKLTEKTLSTVPALTFSAGWTLWADTWTDWFELLKVYFPKGLPKMGATSIPLANK